MADRSGYIGRAPSDSSITVSHQTNQPTGVTTTFVFNSGYDVGYLDAYVNGAKLINAIDYTATDTQNVSLTTAAISGDVVEFVAYKAFNLANVVSSTPGNFLVDGSVTATSFVGGTVAGSTGTFSGAVSGTTGTFSGDVSIADKIIHTGDTNTAIRFPAADTFSVETAGSEKLRITSDGKVFIGSTSDNGPSAYNLANAGLSITAAGENVLRVLDSTSSATDVGGAILIGGNYRSAGDTQPFVELKSFKENGTDSNYAYGFRIGTTPNGGSITERLRITSDGKVRVPDNGKFTAGASDDLEIYHDGSNSRIKNTTGSLWLQSDTGIRFTDSDINESMAAFYDNGAVELYYDGSKKFETKSDGVDITGELQCDTLDVDGLANIQGSLTVQSDILMGDNDRLKIGGNDDIQLYHNATNSYIDNNTNDLYIRSLGDDLFLQAADDIYIQPQGSENGIICFGNSEVQLFYNNSKKLNTVTGGVNITGYLECDAINIDGSYRQAAEAVSALNIDLSAGNYFTKTINGNSTFTFSNAPSSGTVGSFTLELTHTSGTVTWPSSVKFPADTAPTLTAGKTHLFVFVTDDGGSRYRGAALADYVN